MPQPFRFVANVACGAAVGIALSASVAAAQSPSPPSAHAQWYADYLAHSRNAPLPDGRSLSLYCLGSGGPTVILEAGLSETAETWWRIQPELAKETRVCAYDRAGYGHSPPGPLPRDTKAEVADLEAMLREAGLKPPYVMVGHSMGGYIVQLFASRHPDQVAGVVLVDSSVADQLLKIESRIPSIADNDRRSIVRTRACADPARTERVAQLCARKAPADFPPDLAKAYGAISGLSVAQTRVSEIEAFKDVDSAEVKAEFRPLGETPLVLLTRGARSTDLPPEDAELEWTLWKGLHDGLAGWSKRSVNRVVEGSGHYIQIDRPEAVIQAVSDVIACARSQGRGMCQLPGV